MTTLKQLTKQHGQYKMRQVMYLSSLYELIEQTYDYEELANKSRNDLRAMTREAYSKLEHRGYKIPQLRARRAIR